MAADILASAGFARPTKPTRELVELRRITFSPPDASARFLWSTALARALRSAGGILAFGAWIGAVDVKEDNLLVHREVESWQIKAIDFDRFAFSLIASDRIEVPQSAPLVADLRDMNLQTVLERIESMKLGDFDLAMRSIPAELRQSDLPLRLPELLLNRGRLLRRALVQHASGGMQT